MKQFSDLSEFLDQAWLLSFTLLVLMHLVDIQYFDGKISVLFWILLAGLRNIIKKGNPEYSFN